MFPRTSCVGVILLCVVRLATAHPVAFHDANLNARADAIFIDVRAATLYVDDNGIGDPAPGDAQISDPQENGTPEHPFDLIQEAIVAVGNGGTVRINPGRYRENIDFLGKSISIIGLDPNDPNTKELPVIDGARSGPVVRFSDGEGPGSLLMGLALSGGQDDTAGGIVCHNSHLTMAHCLITGNRSLHPDGAGIWCTDSNVVFVQCTIADNVCGSQGAGLVLQDSEADIQDSILWGNTPQQIQAWGGSVVSMRYSNVEDSFPGLGNLEVDPAFVQPGYWAHINDTSLRLEPHDPLGQWTTGDYHLQSQAGRWQESTQSWITDPVTSACIDAGDPSKSVGYEPPPHGDRANMGVYGATAGASQSFVLEDDGRVHFQDDVLKSKVQEALSIWGDPTPVDMLELIGLDASYSQIQDLTGLQYAKNLQDLNLRWNKIDDISILSRLTELEHLNLSQNNISDLSPLSGLLKLQYLNLHWNEVEDLTPLSQLTNLTFLMLKQNHIADISALSGLNNLEDLYLNANFRINDISPLADKTKLTNLYLQFNDITDLSALSGLTQLMELDLNNNKITDLDNISRLKNLKLLNVKGNPLAEIVYVYQLDKISNNNPGIDLRYDPNPY